MTATAQPIPAPEGYDAPHAGPVWQLGRHIPQLDGVRGLAILIVTLYRFSKEIPTDTWLGKALHASLQFGDRGVELFFVLSGFLITGILFDAKGGVGYFTNFLARRSLRIFPLYFVALALFLGLSRASTSLRGTFAQACENQFYLWTYLTNVKMSWEGSWCFGYLDHFWSLAVEEHFYFVWPVVIFLCSRKTALKLAVALALMSALSRIVFAYLSTNGVAPDVLSVFRFDALLIGSIIALQIRSPEGLQKYRVPAYFLFVGSLVLGAGLAILDKRAYTLAHTIWPLLWASLLTWLLLSNNSSPLARVLDLAPLKKLGKYSYAMYVFQSPLIPLTAAVVSVAHFEAWTGEPLTANLIYIGFMFALTFGAALLSWHLLEKHCLKAKKWFPNRTKSPRGNDRAERIAADADSDPSTWTTAFKR